MEAQTVGLLAPSENVRVGQQALLAYGLSQVGMRLRQKTGGFMSS